MAYQEFLPSTSRGRSFVLFTMFWSVGSSICIIVSWAVLPALGWRWLVALTTTPIMFFMVCSAFIPETPIFLSEANRSKDCLNTLQQVLFSIKIRPIQYLDQWNIFFQTLLFSDCQHKQILTSIWQTHQDPVLGHHQGRHPRPLLRGSGRSHLPTLLHVVHLWVLILRSCITCRRALYG